MARVFEHQAKEMLRKFDIPVPEGQCVASAIEARRVAEALAKPVVAKAQAWMTGRLKAGGIRFADTPEEAEKAARGLLSGEIKGFPIEKVLVEERLEVKREFYVGVTVSNSYKIKGPVLILSTEGGTSIEEVSSRSPEKIIKLSIDYVQGLEPEDANQLISSRCFDNSLSREIRRQLVGITCNVYRAFTQYEARSVEINPLILTKDNRMVAADCHITLDDNAVFRHPEFGVKVPRDMNRPPTPLEEKAWATIEEGDYRGTGYFTQMSSRIEGEGWLGFHGIGGGGAMLGASAFLARGLKIANYADTSGDPPASKIYAVIKYILSQPVDGYVLMGACLANQEQWHHAHASVKAFREEARKRPGFPVVILLAGNKEREAHRIIRDGFKSLPLRWELYGRDYIYDTDFIAKRVEALLTAYQRERQYAQGVIG